MTDHLIGSEADADADGWSDGASTSDGSAGESDEDTATPAADSAWTRWRERRRNRVSKWDRPPDPKDWRYFVGTLGKVLIATGLLMFGFVAYQLWGTGIETARAQNSLENTFEAAIAANQDTDDAAPATTPATSPTDDTDADGTDHATDDTDAGTDSGPDTGTDTGTDNATLDTTDAEEAPEPSAGVGGGTPSEVVPGGVDLSDEAVVQNVPIVPPGEAIAKMEIPRIGIDDLYVVQGVKLDDLKDGPGHYPDTPLPGQLGNASIAGHRTTYGAPFFNVDKLQPGDEIIVTMVTGDRFVYSVTGSQVVTAADSWVIGTRDPNVAELTLTTCDPKYTALNRLIIHSVLVPEKSARVGQAEFWDAGTREVILDDDSAAASDDADRPAGDDPTFDSGGGDTGDDASGAKTSADDTTDITTDVTVEPGESSDAVFLDGDDPSTVDAATDDAAATTDDAAADDAADDTSTDEATAEASVGDAGDSAAADEAASSDPDDAEIDAFSEGWFDDREAWPQIALWGSALTIISLLAFQISKKTRHDSIGFTVGILPFLLALYFFFQNINRLLPPGL